MTNDTPRGPRIASLGGGHGLYRTLEAARALDARGRVVPVVDAPLDIEADVCGLGGDPRIMRLVRGQVAVASTPGQVRRVRIVPDDPTPNPEALRAIRDADLVTIGPGSWFSSVIPHLLVPGVVDALAETSAVKVVVVNLAGEPGETQDFSTERHIHMLRQQAPDIRADYVLVDPSAIPSEAERDNIRRAAAGIGARLAVAPVRRGTSAAHDPEALARALAEALRGS